MEALNSREEVAKELRPKTVDEIREFLAKAQEELQRVNREKRKRR